MTPDANETKCYRCGMKGHWPRICRTTKYLVELYQASLKDKDKAIEANFTSQHVDDANLDNVNIDVTHLDITDFFEHPKGKIDHLIGDGNVPK